MSDHHVFKTARFNTKNEEEAQVVDIIEYYENQQPKVSFKELVVDALLRYQGIDPVVFQKGDYPYRKPVTADEVRMMLSELQQPTGVTVEDIAALIEQIPQPQSTGITLDDVQRLLEKFADEIIRHFKKQSGAGNRRRADYADEEDEETVSAFAQNFARGFMQRQQQGRGDSDE